MSSDTGLDAGQDGGVAVGWQPIETAPTDGTEIIALSGAKGVSLAWFFKPSSRTQSWLDQRGRCIDPTHWMPLPPHPVSGSAKEPQAIKGAPTNG